MRISNLVLACSECHRYFASNPEPPRILFQHRHVRVDHGTVVSCFECHSIENHDELLLEDGATVLLDESDAHCGSCHEPQWDDWMVGVHGQTVGTWLRAADSPARLSCVACHDPHAPAFDPFAPLPGPDALRTAPGEE